MLRYAAELLDKGYSMRAPKSRTPVLYLIAASAFASTWLLTLWATHGGAVSQFSIPAWLDLLAWPAAAAAIVCAGLMLLSYHQRHANVVEGSHELTKLDELAVASTAVACLSIAWVLYFIG